MGWKAKFTIELKGDDSGIQEYELKGGDRVKLPFMNIDLHDGGAVQVLLGRGSPNCIWIHLPNCMWFKIPV